MESEFVGEFVSRLAARDPAFGERSIEALLGRDGETAALARNLIGERLLIAAETVAREAGVKNVHSILAHGDPARTIVAFCEDNSADAVVPGTHFHGQVRAESLGSITQTLLQLRKRPSSRYDSVNLSRLITAFPL